MLESKMLVGISNPPLERLFDEDWLQRFQVSEWRFHTLLELSASNQRRTRRLLEKTKHRLVISGGREFFPKALAMRTLYSIDEVIQEHLALATELKFHFLALSLKVPSTMEGDHLYLAAILRELKSECSLWIEGGREAISLKLPGTQRVADPLWHPNSVLNTSRVFKVHGWHSERWVRYYGPEQLRTLEKLCKKRAPQILLFGHSKREEEGGRFQKLRYQKWSKV